MEKSEAIRLLGGSIVEASKAVGVSYQAVRNWPDPLPRRIEDRVIAVLARKHFGELIRLIKTAA